MAKNGAVIPVGCAVAEKAKAVGRFAMLLSCYVRATFVVLSVSFIRNRLYLYF